MIAYQYQRKTTRTIHTVRRCHPFAVERQIVAIKTLVATRLKVTVEQIDSRDRSEHTSLARRVAMYICRQHLRLPYETIDLAFNRETGNSFWAYRRARSQAHFHPIIRALLSELQTFTHGDGI